MAMWPKNENFCSSYLQVVSSLPRGVKGEGAEKLKQARAGKSPLNKNASSTPINSRKLVYKRVRGRKLSRQKGLGSWVNVDPDLLKVNASITRVQVNTHSEKSYVSIKHINFQKVKFDTP